jgi:hypothetical protein
MTVPSDEGRLASATLVNQFVIMEENDWADKIKALRPLTGLSYAEIIRQCVRYGGYTGVLKRHGIDIRGAEYTAAVELARSKRVLRTLAQEQGGADQDGSGYAGE